MNIMTPKLIPPLLLFRRESTRFLFKFPMPNGWSTTGGSEAISNFTLYLPRLPDWRTCIRNCNWWTIHWTAKVSFSMSESLPILVTKKTIICAKKEIRPPVRTSSDTATRFPLLARCPEVCSAVPFIPSLLSFWNVHIDFSPGKKRDIPDPVGGLNLKVKAEICFRQSMGKKGV